MRTNLSFAGEELLRKQILLNETSEDMPSEIGWSGDDNYYYSEAVWVGVSMSWTSSFNLPREPSIALSPEQRDEYKRHVSAAWKKASKENWDGAGARAVSEDTCAQATAIVDWFLPQIDAPSITATPHGEIDFDWCLDNGRMLTISVGPEGDVAFAWLHGKSRHAGNEPWDGQLVQTIRCYLQRLLV